MEISSPRNPRIKALLRLRDHSRERHRGGLILVEGLDEISLAVSAGHPPTAIVGAPSLQTEQFVWTGGEELTVSEAVFRQLSTRENPDGWLATFARPTRELDQLALPGDPLVLVLESLEKPGNLGAILRTADAAHVDAVLVCERRGDVFGPNAIRASRGAVFAVPVVEATNEEALAFLRARRIPVAAANANAGVNFQQAGLGRELAIALGREDTGLSAAWLGAADVQVRIPMMGKVNSLNVSVAAALLLYEARRQRT